MVRAFEIHEGPAAAHCSELVTYGRSLETSGYAGHSEERLPHCKVAAPLPVEQVGDDGAVGCCQRTPELSARSLQGNETRAIAFSGAWFYKIRLNQITEVAAAGANALQLNREHTTYSQAQQIGHPKERDDMQERIVGETVQHCKNASTAAAKQSKSKPINPKAAFKRSHPLTPETHSRILTWSTSKSKCKMPPLPTNQHAPPRVFDLVTCHSQFFGYP